MLADALRAGVTFKLPSQMDARLRSDYELSNDDPVVTQYQGYMAALPPADGSDVEALIQVHRRLQFRWRSALERQPNDYRVLGKLYAKVTAATCAAVPPATDADHPKCVENQWNYEVPPDPSEQAAQLLREQRRLVQQIAFLRHPIERRPGDPNWPPPEPRKRTAYEDLILGAWEEPAALPPAVDGLLAEHVHDSVAHFTSWPCALYDPRGVYCDTKKYYADAKTGDAQVA
jgi:hypothetical protein